MLWYILRKILNIPVGDYEVRFLGTDYLRGGYTGKDIPIDIVWLNRDHDYSTTKLKELIKTNA